MKVSEIEEAMENYWKVDREDYVDEGYENKQDDREIVPPCGCGRENKLDMRLGPEPDPRLGPDPGPILGS